MWLIGEQNIMCIFQSNFYYVDVCEHIEYRTTMVTSRSIATNVVYVHNEK